MPKKNLKIAYFSLPERIAGDLPKTYLFLDKNEIIRVKTAFGKEISHIQLARLWARGSITLTDEGKKFIEKFK